MKAAFSIVSILFILLACQNKQNQIPPLPDTIPDATILVVNINDSNTAAFTFRLNNGEAYTFDFGDGSTLTDSLAKDAITSEYQRIFHQYKKNGDYKVILTVKNRSYSSQDQTIVEAKRIAIADFSYEVLENGQVKLNNLSENNAESYQWFISSYSMTNGNIYFYTSIQKEPIINFDLNGKYKIKLQAINGNTSEVDKTIAIRNARKHMSFSGYYKGEKINIPLDSADFYYGCLYSSYSIGQYFGKSGEEQPLFWREYSSPYDVTKEKKYTLIRDFIKAKDTDVIELEEEILDPELYNNSGKIYSKAFWIKYKVKNEHVDGELQVRLFIY